MASPEPPPVSPTDTSPLEQYRLPRLPPSIYYIPAFLTASESHAIASAIPPHRWIHLSHRRLQPWPAPLSGKNNALLDAPLPPWLAAPALARFRALGLFAHSPHAAPNHVLINEYRAGEGIMAHEDGAAYWGCVATVSLGGATVLEIRPKGRESDPGEEEEEAEGKECCWRILQEPDSLLVTTDAVYGTTLHGIAETSVDKDLNSETLANWHLLRPATREQITANGGRSVRETRTSLTYRDVRRVVKVKGVGAASLLGRVR